MAAVRPDTALCAVMLVNNELGTLQPVAEIVRGAARAAGARAHLHCDAVQAAGLLPIDLRALGVDTLAVSAHKLHGPRGAGALWVRPGARLAPLWDGGRQERGLRSGTENLPAVAGFARAAALARGPRRRPQVARLRDRLEARGGRPAAAGAAHRRRRARPGRPTSPACSLPELPAEPILHALEARGVYASAGSACATRTRGPSHVLEAIGVPDDAAVLRFSLARTTTEAEVVAGGGGLAEAVAEVGRRGPDRRGAAGGRGALAMSQTDHPVPLRRAVPQAGQPLPLRAAAPGQRAHAPWPAFPASP